MAFGMGLCGRPSSRTAFEQSARSPFAIILATAGVVRGWRPEAWSAQNFIAWPAGGVARGVEEEAAGGGGAAVAGAEGDAGGDDDHVEAARGEVEGEPVRVE